MGGTTVFKGPESHVSHKPDLVQGIRAGMALKHVDVRGIVEFKGFGHRVKKRVIGDHQCCIVK